MKETAIRARLLKLIIVNLSIGICLGLLVTNIAANASFQARAPFTGSAFVVKKSSNTWGSLYRSPVDRFTIRDSIAILRTAFD